MPLTTEDQELLVQTINTAIGQIPAFLRGAVNPRNISAYLQSVPQNFRRYTLQEIIDGLEEANRNSRFKF